MFTRVKRSLSLPWVGAAIGLVFGIATVIFYVFPRPSALPLMPFGPGVTPNTTQTGTSEFFIAGPRFADLPIETGLRNLFCVGSFLTVRADGFACFPATDSGIRVPSLLLDPCFIVTPLDVVCPYPNRDDNRVDYKRFPVVGRLDITPLKPRISTDSSTLPWLLELSDGTYCYRRVVLESGNVQNNPRDNHSRDYACGLVQIAYLLVNYDDRGRPTAQDVMVPKEDLREREGVGEGLDRDENGRWTVLYARDKAMPLEKTLVSNVWF